MYRIRIAVISLTTAALKARVAVWHTIRRPLLRRAARRLDAL